MSYPSAMPMKATAEGAQKATPGYTLSYHKASSSPKYPFKWTVLGLAATCATFWATLAWLF
jgi:hypothetical protein